MTGPRRFSPCRARILSIATALTPLLLAHAVASAQEPAPTRAPRPQPRALFDGKTLDGWKKTPFSNAGAVAVNDGTITLAAGRPMSGITSTRTDLPRTHYELTYEAQRLEGRDFFAAATFPVGKSYITFVNGGWGGNVTGLSSIDFADASENETTRYVKYTNKTWYRFRVVVTDKVIRCWIDDKPVVALVHEGRSVDTRIETRQSYPLGFATWESAAALRKIAVRPLVRAEIAEANAIEE
jgi:hypothetical protein